MNTVKSNWRTTVSGLGMGGLYLFLSHIQSGIGVKDAGISVGLALLGILAKDAQVTGGSSYQGSTPEVLVDKAVEKQMISLPDTAGLEKTT